MVMEKGLFFAIAASVLIIHISCNKEKNPNCGANNEFNMYLSANSIVDSTTGFYYSYRDGNNRVFQWSEPVSDVCPEEHVKVEFKAGLLKVGDSSQVSARARVSYGILFERTFAMTYDGIDYREKAK